MGKLGGPILYTTEPKSGTRGKSENGAALRDRSFAILAEGLQAYALSASDFSLTQRLFETLLG